MRSSMRVSVHATRKLKCSILMQMSVQRYGTVQQTSTVARQYNNIMTCYFHRLFCKNNELFSLDSRLESVRTAGPESRDWCKYCGTEDRQTSLETINMGICSTRAGFILTSHRTGVGSLMWQQYVIVSMKLRERPNNSDRARRGHCLRHCSHLDRDLLFFRFWSS